MITAFEFRKSVPDMARARLDLVLGADMRQLANACIFQHYKAMQRPIARACEFQEEFNSNAVLNLHCYNVYRFITLKICQEETVKTRAVWTCNECKY